MVPAFVLFNQEESDTGRQEVTVTPAVTEEGSDNSTEGVEVTVTPEKRKYERKGGGRWGDGNTGNRMTTPYLPCHGLLPTISI